MNRRVALATVLILIVATIPGSDAADGIDKRQIKRNSIDHMAVQTLERLASENDTARQLYERSVGYAVFDSFKAAFIVSGGGGVGVAVDRGNGAKTYMKMGTAGIGLGLGGQSYQIVFLFESDAAFQRFVKKGWQADAAANAAAGTNGANVDASFSHGLAVFQLTNKGLMANADISGTKYWKNKKLNGQ